MHILTTNLVRSTRAEKLNGKDFLVAPVTLIVEGVLNGSHGPLFYPLEEIARNAAAWNGVPLVIDHPYVNGEPVSARSPAILNKSGVGSVYNVTLDGSKLRGEAWFCAESLQAASPNILARLRNNEQIEISAGLVGSHHQAEDNATFHGARYTRIVRDHKPDHLAILPNAKGACSIKDGCGIFNKSESDKQDKGGTTMPNDADRKTKVDAVIANSCCYGEKERAQLNEFSDEVLDKLIANDKEDADKAVIANAAKKGFTDPGGNQHTWDDTSNEWKTVVNTKTEPVTPVAPVVPVAPVATVVNEEMTEDQLLASLPQKYRETLINASHITAAEKGKQIDLLTVNVADDAKEATVKMLANKSLDELRTLVTLLPAPDAPQFANAVDYAGQAGAPAMTANVDLGEPLQVPPLFPQK